MSAAVVTAVAANTASNELSSAVIPTSLNSPMTREEIISNHQLTNDRVIIHYGEGIRSAPAAAEALFSRGTPATAVPGGPDCGIYLIIDGMANDEFCFTQANLNRGELTGLAERVYNSMPTHQTAALSPASLNQ